jgi:hypothetical protein
MGRSLGISTRRAVVLGHWFAFDIGLPIPRSVRLRVDAVIE